MKKQKAKFSVEVNLATVIVRHGRKSATAVFISGAWCISGTPGLTTQKALAVLIMLTGCVKVKDAPAEILAGLCEVDGTVVAKAQGPVTYTISLTFTTAKPLTMGELDAIATSAAVQVEDPCDGEGDPLDVQVLDGCEIDVFTKLI